MTEDHIKLVKEKILPLFEDSNINEVLDVLHYIFTMVKSEFENVISSNILFISINVF